MRRRASAPQRCLIATLIVALPGGIVDAQAQTSTAEAASLPQTAVAPAVETGRRWQLAPIRWNGQIGLIANTSDGDSQPRRTQVSETFNVTAASYIWQPWFVQVAAGIGLLFSQTTDSGDSDGGATTRAHSGGGSRGVTGNFGLNVFPVSRFPFQLNVDVTDSRASGDFVGSDFRSTRLGLRQNYRTLAGSTSFTAGVESSTLTSDSFGRDRVNVVDGSMTTAWDNQRLQVNASYSDNSRSSDDLGSHIARLDAQHGWRSDEFLSIDSLASVSHEARRFSSVAPEFRSDVRQLNSLVNWRTDWDEPLIVFGTARLYDATVSGDGGRSTGRNMNLSGSASYRFSRNLSAFGAAAFSYIETGAQNETLTLQSAGAQYQIDPRMWGPATYTANAGVTAANLSGGPLGTRQQYQLQAGHQVLVSIASGESSAWTFSLGQNGGAIDETENGASRTLSHNGSIGWRYAPPAGLAGFASVSLGDSRTYGGQREGRFQLLNFQVSGQLRPGPYSSLSANLTAQATRELTSGETEPRTTHSTSGGATYQHTRAFGVPRLRYVAQFNVYNQQFDQRLQGNPNALRENVTWSLEQRLEYLIGRLDSRLTLRVTEVDGKKSASLIASVYRRFGY